MIKYIFILFIIIYFSACSFKTAPNEWQYKSANAFDSYVNDFMSEQDILAQNDLRQALKYAKKSANLSTLARIYLGKCALNISVGIEDKCKEYQSISNLVDDKELSNYYGIITRTSALNPDTILDSSRATSILLHGVLTKEMLNEIQRAELLKVASYHGYKRAVIFWLLESKGHTQNKNKKAFFQQKIEAIK